MTREEAAKWIEEHHNPETLEGTLDSQAHLLAIEALREKSHSGMYECFHCGSRSVIWGADFSFEDYGREGEGIVHTLHCDNCGAEIEYYIAIGEENKEDVQDSDHE